MLGKLKRLKGVLPGDTWDLYLGRGKSFQIAGKTNNASYLIDISIVSLYRLGGFTLHTSLPGFQKGS